MTVAFIADVHLANHRRFGGPSIGGVNRRCRHILDALDAAVRTALERGAQAMVVCGDLFDTAHPHPQVIAAAQAALAPMPRVFLLMGNHDMVSDQEGDHALGPMAAAGNCEVVSGGPVLRRVGDVELVLVPFRVGEAIDLITEDVLLLGLHPKPVDRVRVLCAHAGIRDNTLGPYGDAPSKAWQFTAKDAVDVSAARGVAELAGADVMVVGNWHTAERWLGDGHPTLVQVGALAPTGFDNPGLHDYGGLTLVGGMSDFSVDLRGYDVAGPRFLVTGGGGQIVDQVTAARAAGCRPYVSLRCGDVVEYRAAKAWLDDARKSGDVVDGEVLLEHAARAAATAGDIAAARSSVGLRDAVDAYVADARSRAGGAWEYGDPEAVAESAMAYLQRARL